MYSGNPAGHPATSHGDRSEPGRAGPSVFDRYGANDVPDLIAGHPLAWCCARDGAADHARLLPLPAERDVDGRPDHLLGRLAHGNPLVDLGGATGGR